MLPSDPIMPPMSGVPEPEKRPLRLPELAEPMPSDIEDDEPDPSQTG
jgi:hypothetical protein